jgi:hypothetical protein
MLVGACLLFVSLCCLVVWDVHRLMPEARQTLEDTRRVVVIAGGAATDLQKTLALERTAATDQIAATTAAIRSTNDTLTAARLTIQNLNTTVTTANGTLEVLSETIAHQNAGLLDVERNASAAIATLDRTAAQLGPVLDSAQTAAANAAKLSSDPAIQQSMANLNAGTASFAAVAANAKTASDLALDRLRQALKPASLMRRIAEGAANWTVKGAQAYMGMAR